MSVKKRVKIRRDSKKLLSNLDLRWVKAASNEICKTLHVELSQDPFEERNLILGWTSFFLGEIDLSLLLNELSEEKMFYLPRSREDYSMDYISVGKNWSESSVEGMYGIPEPADTVVENYSLSEQASNTVVLVPGVSFDGSGNRIGRGEGYYDRFFSHDTKRELIKIGVCWELQLVESISAMEHDVPVDYICTEERFFAVEDKL